jgi:hypothetical protein
MVEEIIFIYSFCSDLLKEVGFSDDRQSKMTGAEVMTVAVVSALYFRGNHDMARRFLKAHGYMRAMLGKSRFNRRVHAIDFDLWQFVLSCLKQSLTKKSASLEYVVDSLPVEVCSNVRSYRCKSLSGKKYIGYCSSKKKYYYGVKVHIIASTSGIPMEVIITPASTADISALKVMEIDIMAGSTIYADKAYTDYEFEDLLQESANIRLVPQRKENMKRQHYGPVAYVESIRRKYIETTFSRIVGFFPRSIVAVTKDGFLIKILLFIVTYVFSIIFRDSALVKSC